MVKKNIRAGKRAYLNMLAVEAEEAANHGNMRAVYANTKTLSGLFNKPERPIKNWGLDCRRRRTEKEKGGIFRGASEETSAKGSSGHTISLPRLADHMYYPYER